MTSLMESKVSRHGWGWDSQWKQLKVDMCAHGHTQEPYSTMLITTSLLTKNPSAFPPLPTLSPILSTRIKDVPLWTREIQESASPAAGAYCLGL